MNVELKRVDIHNSDAIFEMQVFQRLVADKIQ